MGSRKKRVLAFGLGLALVPAALFGCAESSRQATPWSPPPTSLVLPGDGSAVLASGWETGRRDDALGVGAGIDTLSIRAVDVRTYDRRSTSNGRSHENSRTIIRTRGLGIIYGP